MPSPDAQAAPLPPSWRRRLLATELAALLLAAAWAMIFHARLPGHLPSDEDYRAVANVLAAEAKPGDVVLLYPWWTERARLFVPDDLPVVGHLHSDEEPLTDHPRIWLLAQPQLPKSDLGGFLEKFQPGRHREADPREFGNLQLSVYRNELFRPSVFSAVDQLATAHVYLERGGQRSECPWNGRAFQCQGGVHVAAEWHEVNQVPRRCLFMNPPGGDARVVAEWNDVPPATRLTVEGGIIWEYAAHHGDELTDVNVSVEDGSNARLSGFVAKKGVETFYRESAPSPSQPFTLKLSAQSNNPTNRQLCLGLFVRGPAASKDAP